MWHQEDRQEGIWLLHVVHYQDLMNLEKMLVASAGKEVSLTVKRFSENAKPPFRPIDDQFEKQARNIVFAVPAGIQSLADLGIGPYDRVAACLPNDVDIVIADDPWPAD